MYWYLFLFTGLTVFGVGGVVLLYARYLYVTRGRVLGAEYFPRFWTPLVLRSASAAMIGERDLVGAVHAIQCEIRPGRASYQIARVRGLLSGGTPLWMLFGNVV